MYLFKFMKHWMKKKKRPRGRRRKNNQQSPADSGDAINIVKQKSAEQNPLSLLRSSPSMYEYSSNPVSDTVQESTESQGQDLQLAPIRNTISTESSHQVTSTGMQWPADYGRNVQLVELKLSADCKLTGTVMVANLAYHKNIFIRWTSNNWATYHDTVASYDHSSLGYTHDWFTFSADSTLLQNGKDGGVCVELAVAYQVNGLEFWDNNQQQNFTVLLTDN